MYRCYDIDIPHLFIVHVEDLEAGKLDDAVEAGFECLLSPYLALDSGDMQSIVQALVRHGCSHLLLPDQLIENGSMPATIESAPLAVEIVHKQPFQYVAEKAARGMGRDLVAVCEADRGESSAESQLFEWTYSYLHPSSEIIIIPSTTRFMTPLGPVTVEGPDGPIPFKVTKLLNRHYPFGEMKTVGKVDSLFELTVSLDDMEDNVEYFVGCKGAKLEHYDGDERTECCTCVQDGLAFGIGVYDPSDYFGAWTSLDVQESCGYYVDAGFAEPRERPFCIVAVPKERDEVKSATIWVGWLHADQCENGYWEDAEDLLSFFLT